MPIELIVRPDQAAFVKAAHELSRAMRAENMKHSVAVIVTTVLTSLGLTAPHFLPAYLWPALTGKLILGCTVLIANISMVIVAHTWLDVESARHSLYLRSLLHCTEEGRVTQEVYERSVLLFRKTRLLVTEGTLLVYAVGDILMALYR